MMFLLLTLFRPFEHTLLGDAAVLAQFHTLCYHAFIGVTQNQHSAVAMTVFVACHFSKPDRTIKTKASLSLLHGHLKHPYI